ncbi:MAG: O-succinylhomoserine sulfhydrylase [Ferrovum sp. 37-45-19]|uniref:O-succinylhomoserine sulfhydrylase n=1 Tax=Ferrovum sp. JA12 TaxID=1356299 RepID=UPI000703A266|nr:O-succinylhomoserine sulfhydrylase [Ferrovum sp. JA12]OYV80238.1 MAG: O-succinylhomoserine sulfhydrylase [Ferrovum sp. 21-44-67]OYV94515.1 MAG: O-succinylhomoserine sulfhydrylase [Ferrovum sp. 37-45-19]HQT81585.1 O-succinylhomoserine sulfhydrylase [Ferrovaceae bacterium]KRH78920.1 O-succinylhomoserine sulfhydrylase [Ferrovum sp. JA12]HQU06474.1 O-succinylhomoserine sulfhydrylase [Ferrovaceae bacterium]
MTQPYDLDTLAIRSGIHRTEFNEHAEALFLTSSYVFDNAQQAADRFQNKEPGYIYSRFTNPTVNAFQERLAVMEGGEYAIATASGMAAILTTMMGLLKAGDHIVVSQSIFGAAVQLFTNILSRFGIESTFVPLSDIDGWKRAIQSNTKLFYLETPSNPTMELVDIQALAEVSKNAQVYLVVDNCFCTPILQQPLSLGADIVIHSATKYIDGQGRVLGGAIVGSKALLKEGIYSFLRTAGPSLSAFNAWILLKGLETLKLRVEAQSQAALSLAQWLSEHPNVIRVHHPGLVSHPQFELAQRQQTHGGAVVSFEVKGGQEKAWRVIDSTQLISITGNLGDTKTTITHPATTTHGRISEESRVKAGITDGLIRVSVGLESLNDIKTDLSRGLD